MAPLKKTCMVCGDRALGYNFNAVTCESCKAFFRRNATSNKNFSCPFNQDCKISIVTRRFCQKCRLDKCFNIGMKKEHIMTEEEKTIKKQKIEENRFKRKSNTSNKKNNHNFKQENDINLSDTYSETSISSPGDTLNARISQNIQYENNNIDRLSSPVTSECNLIQELTMSAAEIVDSIVNEPECSTAVINHLMKTPKDAVEVLTKIINSSTEALRLISHLINYPGDALKIISKIMNSPFDALTVFTKFMSSPTDALELISKIVNNPKDVLIFIQQLMNSPQDAIEIMNKFINHPAEALKIINNMFKSTKDKNLIKENNVQLKKLKTDQINSSVLSSMLNAAQSPSTSILSDSNNSENIEFTAKLNTNCFNSNHISNNNEISDIVPEYNLKITGEKMKNILEDVEDRPILPNSIESVLCEAIKLEYETYNSLPQNCGENRKLNEAEQAKLTELVVANKALYYPVDDDLLNLFNEDERIKCDNNQQDPQLLKVINLTAVAIRRLIKMSKKISAFRNMCEEDQVALLKGGCTEMMIMRSVMTYDCDHATWKIPHSKEDMSNIKVDILKLAKGNVYEVHERFIQTFEPKWRMDENIILIMCAIVLFSPIRPRIIHSDVIKLEQNSYYYLLRRYLESVYPGCEAKSTFIKLIQKISEVQRLNEVIIGVYLNVNPSQVEPLLREIFDLKNPLNG